MIRQPALCLLVLASFSATPAAAQEELPKGWSPGPVEGSLGQVATIAVPEGYFFLDAQATRVFLEENQNIPDGDELGVILRVLPDDNHWFAVFSYSETGHVDDRERESLDADAILKGMKEGSRRANAERQKRGWATLDLVGWHQAPFYDQATNNLTWSTRLSSNDIPVLNHSVRLLGRTGTMSVQLVMDPGSVDVATTEFNDALRGYAYNAGQRYAEFRQGDKLAGYGLTALIAGGAGAAAVKTGLLQKFWKLIVVGVIALLGAVKRFLAGLTSGGQAKQHA
jgi:uncharacterized membrane-anchored protein